MTAMSDEQERKQLWDAVKVLAKIDREKAEVVLKTTIEKSLQFMNIHAPIISEMHFYIPDDHYLSQLKEFDARLSKRIAVENSEDTYGRVLDYVDLISNITKESAQPSRKLIASMLAENAKSNQKTHTDISSIQPIVSLEYEGNHYYKPNEAAKKLGLSDQTIRRMCERGKFKGAFRTDGGHWRIPKDNVITDHEQDKKAEAFFEHIDRKNREAGDVDEFDL